MHTLRRLLIANRGEIAVRIARTATDLGIEAVAVHAQDDAALPTQLVQTSVALPGSGAAAYLDVDAVVQAAQQSGCDAVHPGYGFLSENARFARACAAAGLVFVGPEPETLELFGDKGRARALATATGVPVLRGTDGPTSLEQAQELLAELGPGGALMVKAVHGGGGRGMRAVRNPAELAAAYERCASEAAASFGDGSLYVEQLLEGARHIEVQIVGDGHDVTHLWDRDCSLQRARAKVVEIAPAVTVVAAVRARLAAAAVALGRAARYRGVGTVEFLVAGDTVAFIEANARLQVEHTVTEEVTGRDLVAVQLDLAAGASLADLGLDGEPVTPSGVAVQARVNLETVDDRGLPRPAAGTLTAYEAPSGPGVRVDGFAAAGYRTSTRYDPLLAKVIAHVGAGGLEAALRRAVRALGEFRVDGVPTNIPFLRSLLSHPEVIRGALHTTFVEEHAPELATLAPEPEPAAASPARRGARIDAVDPLAVLAHGKVAAGEPAGPPPRAVPDGSVAVQTPIVGTVVSVAVGAGDEVAEGATVLVLESMKLEHVVTAPCSGIVREVLAAPGDALDEGQPVAFVTPAAVGASADGEDAEVDPEHVRADLAEVLERHQRVLDEQRPKAVARRRGTAQRTARENVEDLLDPGTFVEYGPLVVAARRRRHSLEELIDQTPADGLVMGLGQVNGARVAVLAYDYTVLAGTQGARNHQKLDRMAELALRWRLPVVFFTEGGGGRPGDTEGAGFIRGFEFWGRLSGKVPLVGITSGRCFAGNAAILGCCDVVIATRDSTIGMGGPAMVEGGGLGVFRPEEIGPVEVMDRNGVIDVLVEDEAQAVQAAKRYLSYVQGSHADWAAADQRRLRHVIPENRLRAYDVRRVIDLLFDTGSVLELRPRFGRAAIVALARVAGRPAGVIANNPLHLGGAIDSDAADKMARFLQLCEAYQLPVVSLQDTPGIMVGPDVEQTALVRHAARLFVIGANLSVPILAVVLRKSYGLGAIAMTGGSYQAAMFAVSWPTGEFGGMGLEGAVKLGYRKELAAVEDPVERRRVFDEMVARAYQAGRALSQATDPALDDVIDPAETRRWLLGALDALPPAAQPPAPLRWLDAW